MATPVLFAPVRIAGRDYVDGGIGEVAHADLAERAGCRLVLIINPMVPVHADPSSREVPTGHGPMKRVRDKGLLWVYNQSWRMRAEDQFRRGIERFETLYPATHLELLEPDRAKSTMFMYSPTNFAARRAILEEAYASTLRLLRDEGSRLRRAFVSRGFTPRVPQSVAPKSA
jgi:predicted acylesterase/phospholipase RssA